MNQLRALSFAVCSMIGLAACAHGTEAETSFTPGDGEGGNGGFGGAASGGPTTGDGSSTSGGGGDASTGSASSTGSSGSSSSSGSGGPGCDYGATNTCPASDTLSAIAGDKNNDTRTVKGTTSKWFKVLVNEAVSSIIDYPQLSYTASLASPAGMDFDLFVYDGTVSTPSCGGNPKHAVGSPESVSETWGDSLGNDDTLWLTLEVRYISGDICPEKEWTLTVKGHTFP